VPVVSSNRKILAAGVLGGLVFGLVLAVVAARLSRKVLDNEEASEILQVPVVGSVPRYGISNDRRAVVEYLPANATPFIDHLRVRTDALDRQHHALVVVVTGTDVSVGTTSLAGALANRFALNGAEVIVVDADPLHPELSQLFELQPAGLPAYPGGPPRSPGSASLLRPTRVPTLQVVAAADMMESGSVLRREDVPKLVARLDPHADVIIVDGGPFLGAASTVQFAHIADAVVLVIPSGRQQKQALALIGRELREQQPNVLAVTTPSTPLRRR
jgi:Mrp family chromosome partitioning ATPase